MLIEVDITQETPLNVEITDPLEKCFTQPVAFEWKPEYCKKCLKMGHKIDVNQNVANNPAPRGYENQNRGRQPTRVWVPRAQPRQQIVGVVQQIVGSIQPVVEMVQSAQPARVDNVGVSPSGILADRIPNINVVNSFQALIEDSFEELVNPGLSVLGEDRNLNLQQ